MIFYVTQTHNDRSNHCSVFMPLTSKKKRIYKNQLRETNGRFGTSKKFKETHQIHESFDYLGVEEVEKDLGIEESLVVDDEWGDEEDSGWEDEGWKGEGWDEGWDEGWEDEEVLHEREGEKLTNLVWKDIAILEKKKRGPYLVGPTKKSTYYDKWGPNGVYTVAASNTKNITDYFSFATKNSNDISSPDIGDEILEGLDNIGEKGSWKFDNTLQKVSTLKIELEKSHKKMSVIEYNKKKAIFEYLQRLDENGKGKMDASMEAAKIVFINAGSYKATMIRKWAAYWLKTGRLPPVYHGKHQKTIRLIDDEDIANKCKTWIRSQGEGVTPKTFKDFVEKILLNEIGIIKRKSILYIISIRLLLLSICYLPTRLSNKYTEQS